MTSGRNQMFSISDRSLESHSFFLLFVFLYVCVLPTYMSVRYVSARPAEGADP